MKKKAPISANNLEELAQKVWATSDMTEKKTILFEMIDNFKFKAKQDQFRELVEGQNKSARLDRLASDLMLADTDKVVRI